MYRALTFCSQDTLSFACIARGGGGGGGLLGTDPIYWSRFTLGKKKSQVAFIPGGKGSLIPVHNFTESCYRKENKKSV